MRIKLLQLIQVMNMITMALPLLMNTLMAYGQAVTPHAFDSYRDGIHDKYADYVKLVMKNDANLLNCRKDETPGASENRKKALQNYINKNLEDKVLRQSESVTTSANETLATMPNMQNIDACAGSFDTLADEMKRKNTQLTQHANSLSALIDPINKAHEPVDEMKPPFGPAAFRSAEPCDANYLQTLRSLKEKHQAVVAAINAYVKKIQNTVNTSNKWISELQGKSAHCGIDLDKKEPVNSAKPNTAKPLSCERGHSLVNPKNPMNCTCPDGMAYSEMRGTCSYDR